LYSLPVVGFGVGDFVIASSKRLCSATGPCPKDKKGRNASTNSTGARAVGSGIENTLQGPRCSIIV
jgi:hypothetical protein